jgi:ribosomal silencing factor RsfS
MTNFARSSLVLMLRAGGDGGKKNAWSLIDVIDVVVDHHSHDG